jgi:PST family polysaccharide transporter
MARRLINATLGPVLFPSLIEGKSKGEDINQHFHDILGMLNVINICIALPLIFLAKPLTLVLWGEDWLQVADYLPYVGVIIPLQSITIAADDLYMIDKKEKAYLTLGIPSALILVAGIVVGSFFSPLHILRFYSIAFVMVQTPVLMYFGYYRILNFTRKQIFIFWLPKVLLTTAMIFSIWFGNMFITGILMALFIVDTVYFRFSDIKEIFIILKASIRKKEAGNNW